MNNQLQIQNFEFQTHGVRVVMIEGEPWFVAKDICICLGIKKPRNTVARLKDRYKQKYVVPPDAIKEGSPSGGPQQMTVVNESGLYKLIFMSHRPDAEAFQDWVTDEVLPQIRQTGGYGTPQVDFSNLVMVEKMLTTLRDTLIENQELKNTVSIMEPKVDFYDYALQSKEGLNVSLIGKEFGVSGKKMNALLCEWHVQYKQGGRYYLYHEYANQGYCVEYVHKVDGRDTVTHMKWTHKGRLFLHELMKQHGYMPVALISF